MVSNSLSICLLSRLGSRFLSRNSSGICQLSRLGTRLLLDTVRRAAGTP